MTKPATQHPLPVGYKAADASVTGPAGPASRAPCAKVLAQIKEEDEMAATPQFKVYDRFGGYMASVKEIEAGAALMALYGYGATIRWGHTRRNTLWTEGVDGEAAESWDHVSRVAWERRKALFRD